MILRESKVIPPDDGNPGLVPVCPLYRHPMLSLTFGRTRLIEAMICDSCAGPATLFASRAPTRQRLLSHWSGNSPRAPILATSPVPYTALMWFLSLCGNTCLGMSHFLYSTPPTSSPRQPPSKSCILTYLEQLAMWMAGPRQSWPPQRGLGESQARARQRQEPELSPSKCSHGCHGDHWPKPPSRVTFRTCRYTSNRSHEEG